MTQDTVERLDQLLALNPGDPFPTDWDSNNWGPQMHALLSDTKAEIERLRAFCRMATDAAALASYPKFFSSYTADVSIVGNTPTTGGKLDYSKWLATIPEPIEPGVQGGWHLEPTGFKPGQG